MGKLCMAKLSIGHCQVLNEKIMFQSKCDEWKNRAKAIASTLQPLQMLANFIVAFSCVITLSKHTNSTFSQSINDVFANFLSH